MRLTVEAADLGGCRAVAFDRGAGSWAIVLPGAGYPAEAPMLWYARRACLEAGRNVVVITDAFDRERDDPVKWVRRRAQAALDHVRANDARPVLIAKSLTSLAAPLAADAGLPAVWLTPLIGGGGTTVAAEVVAGLQAGGAARLLVGGLSDPSWDSRVAASIPAAEVLELPDADHSLEVPDDVARSLANLATVTDAIRRFVGSLTQPP